LDLICFDGRSMWKPRSGFSLKGNSGGNDQRRFGEPAHAGFTFAEIGLLASWYIVLLVVNCFL
jgi:hypothetical protein